MFKRPKSWTIEPCDLERVLPLRQRITYAGKRDLDACVFPGDLIPQARHWVAVADGRDIGIGSLTYSPVDLLEERPAWLLQFLAVEEDWRGRGVASGLVRTRLEYVRAQGADYAWCQARTAVAPLYEHLGARRGEVMYDLPPIGLHVSMLYGPLS